MRLGDDTPDAYALLFLLDRNKRALGPFAVLVDWDPARVVGDRRVGLRPRNGEERHGSVEINKVQSPARVAGKA